MANRSDSKDSSGNTMNSTAERSGHEPVANRSPGRPIKVAGVLAFSLLAVGCSSVRGERAEPPPAEQTPVTLQMLDETEIGETDTDVIRAAFDFEAPDLYNLQPTNGLEWYDNSPTIVTFVTPGCPVCVEEGPKLANAADLHPEINYVVIHSFGDQESYLDFVDLAELGQENVIHLMDDEGVLWSRFGVSSQPSTVMVDSEGQLTSSRGALGDDGLVRAAEAVQPEA